jgi:hypothetical protein
MRENSSLEIIRRAQSMNREENKAIIRDNNWRLPKALSKQKQGKELREPKNAGGDGLKIFGRDVTKPGDPTIIRV